MCETQELAVKNMLDDRDMQPGESLNTGEAGTIFHRICRICRISSFFFDADMIK